MHKMRIMQYLKGIGLLLAFVLALALPALSETVVLTADASVSAHSPIHGTSLDQFVSLSASDNARNEVAAADEASAPAGWLLAAYAPAGNSKDQAPELEDFVRHRGFTKFFLVVILCGAIVRFFTSPTFMAFVTDILDPEVW
jgi:hypothetical protein